MVVSTRETVLLPRAEKFHTAARFQPAPQLKGLAGKSICVVDNRKPNAEPLMDNIAELLSRDYGPAKVTRIRKDVAASNIKEEWLKRIQTEYDAVVEGLCS